MREKRAFEASLPPLHDLENLPGGRQGARAGGQAGGWGGGWWSGQSCEGPDNL